MHHTETFTLSGQVELRDIEIATTLAFKYTLDSEELLKGAESRQAFTDFVDVVALAHPVDRWVTCKALHSRNSSAEEGSHLEASWIMRHRLSASNHKLNCNSQLLVTIVNMVCTVAEQEQRRCRMHCQSFGLPSRWRGPALS